VNLQPIRKVVDRIPKDSEYGQALHKALLQAEIEKKYAALSYLLLLEKYPVSITEFIESPLYLDKAGEIYPKVMVELLELNNPDGDRLGGKYNEAVLTGSIGSAKTTCALLTTAYQLYIMSCFRNPHKVFGLDKSSEILFIFQSLSGTAAKNVDYGRFRALIEHSPYFNSQFSYQKDIESELRFPHRIFVRPVSGDIGGTIGQNVFGGLIDEVNFMEITEKSKKSVDGGTYDQAAVLYDSISRRRKSRFMQQGRLPGIMCLVSSKHYPGQFTDGKVAEAETDPTIFVYDKRTWDVMPEGTFTNEWFWIYKGSDTKQPFIVEDESHYDLKDPLFDRIPVEYKPDFQRDIMGSLRDIAGVSTIAKRPFIYNTESITKCMGRVNSVFSRSEVDFKYTQLGIYPGRLRDSWEPRAVHVDLAKTGDSAGFCMGYVKGFMSIRRGDVIEYLPDIRIDALLRIMPPQSGEINFSKIRELIYKLSGTGFPIKWVTLDSWQSTDMIQILRGRGYITGELSVDRTILPYDLTKAGLYDGRIAMPFHEVCKRELASLEIDPKKNKIDHPPRGSKDVSDALAGVVSTLTLRREIWAKHGVPINPQLQQRIQQQKQKENSNGSSSENLGG
jgi:hypothetical protein